MPDFSIELAAGLTPICGVDEAGRGPLAGPVVAAAVIFKTPEDAHPAIHDSKRLSAQKRLILCQHIQEHAFTGLGMATVEEIDEINILQASLLAMKRAVEALPTIPQLALIDGNRLPDLPCQAQYVVKGDQKSTSIAAASIIAKVTRDQMMEEFALQYPHYGFEKHAGYGTKIHLQALQHHGPCPIHRKSFTPVRNALQQAA